MPEPERRLILFARFPSPGRVKTRLIPALGAEGAAALHRRLVLRTLRTADASCQSHPVDLEIRIAGGSESQIRHWLGEGWRYRPQCEGNLGRRMACAFEDSFSEGSPATVIIGSDCPDLSPERLTEAFERLRTHRVVFGPATDGGYYLVGLREHLPGLFRDIAWGTDSVLPQSLEILRAANIIPSLLPPLDDLDRPADLAHWQQIEAGENTRLDRVSVILPTLNEAAHLAETLAAVRKGKPWQIIVVDGGSTDETLRIAAEHGALTLESSPGRARQLNAGAARATGNTLLFLHADTKLPDAWLEPIVATLKQPRVAAGAFGFRISGSFRGKAIIETTTNWRSRWMQTPYGDQGLFLRRAVFEKLGGYADLPIMEDFELVQRLRRQGRIVTLRAAVSTSGRRWERLGVIRTTLTNGMMVIGYHLGVSPRKLARLYRGEKPSGQDR